MLEKLLSIMNFFSSHPRRFQTLKLFFLIITASEKNEKKKFRIGRKKLFSIYCAIVEEQQKKRGTFMAGCLEMLIENHHAEKRYTIVITFQLLLSPSYFFSLCTSFSVANLYECHYAK